MSIRSITNEHITSSVSLYGYNWRYYWVLDRRSDIEQQWTEKLNQNFNKKTQFTENVHFRKNLSVTWWIVHAHGIFTEKMNFRNKSLIHNMTNNPCLWPSMGKNIQFQIKGIFFFFLKMQWNTSFRVYKPKYSFVSFAMQKRSIFLQNDALIRKCIIFGKKKVKCFSAKVVCFSESESFSA